MANVAIYCHGTREGGTSTGTYVLPDGVTIYFFSEDTTAMKTQWCTYFLKSLCCEAPDEAGVQKFHVEKKGPYETVPNYDLSPESGWPYPTGVYLVGGKLDDQSTLISPITHKTKLSDVIGGQSKGGVIGNTIYFLVCRFQKGTGNRFKLTPSQFAQERPVGANVPAEMAASFEAMDMGRKPSQIKTTGKWL